MLSFLIPLNNSKKVLTSLDKIKFNKTNTSIPINLSQEEKNLLNTYKSIPIRVSENWAPFFFVDSYGFYSGILYDLLVLLEQKLDFSFTILSEKDQKVELVDNTAILLTSLYKTDEMTDFFTYTKPLYTDSIVFITKETSSYIFNPNEAQEKVFVFYEGSFCNNSFKVKYPNLTYIKAVNQKEAFIFITEGKADICISSLALASHTLIKEGHNTLSIVGFADKTNETDFFLGFNNETKALIPIINKAIMTFSEEEKQMIVSKYTTVRSYKTIGYTFLVRLATLIFICFFCAAYIISQAYKINTELVGSEKMKSLLLSHLPGIVFRIKNDKDYTIEYVSHGIKSLTGYTEKQIHNKEISWNNIICPEYRALVRSTYEKAAKNKEKITLEYSICTSEGQHKWVYEQGMFITNSSGKIVKFEGLIVDISERKKIETELYRLSIFDQLTGLYNRRYIFDRLNVLIEESNRKEKLFCIAILDLDFFKNINDTHGHPYGDYVLANFSNICKNNLRPYDLIGRYGGEEFIVILLNSGKRESSEVIQRIKDSVNTHTFSYMGISTSLTFSTGISCTAEFSSILTREKLINLADKRLYTAKDQGRNRIIDK